MLLFEYNLTNCTWWIEHVSKRYALSKCLVVLIFCYALAASTKASAVTVRPMGLTGVMQQPASQYYHLVYGGNLDISLVDSWSIRGTYFERPAFHSAGYVDQDFFAYAQTGVSFFRKGIFDVYSYIGAGRGWGYLKEESPTEGREKVRRNDYTLQALALSMEVSALFSWADVRIGHSLFVGKGDNDQTKSQVAWPFATYYLALSTPIDLWSKARR